MMTNYLYSGVRVSKPSPLFQEEDGDPSARTLILQFPNGVLQDNTTAFFVNISSDPNLIDKFDSLLISTTTLGLTASNTNYIHNNDILQPGARFNIASGTLVELNVSTIGSNTNFIVMKSSVQIDKSLDMNDNKQFFDGNKNSFVFFDNTTGFIRFFLNNQEIYRIEP